MDAFLKINCQICQSWHLFLAARRWVLLSAQDDSWNIRTENDDFLHKCPFIDLPWLEVHPSLVLYPHSSLTKPMSCRVLATWQTTLTENVAFQQRCYLIC